MIYNKTKKSTFPIYQFGECVDLIWECIEIIYFHSAQHSEAGCFNVRKNEIPQTNLIAVWNFQSLPVIAPAWLRALLKISVQNLCAPKEKEIH